MQPLTPGDTPAGDPAALPAPGDALVVLRARGWRFLIPLAAVERILPAALPAALPSATSGAAAVRVGAELLPVIFCAAFLGGEPLELAAEHRMVLVRDRDRAALLWTDAVEDLVEHEPFVPEAAGPTPGGELVLGFSGRAPPLAILDVGRLLAAATPSP